MLEPKDMCGFPHMKKGGVARATPLGWHSARHLPFMCGKTHILFPKARLENGPFFAQKHIEDNADIDIYVMPYGRKRKRYTKRTTSRVFTGKKAYRKTARTGYKRRKAFTKTSTFRPKWINPLSQKELIRFVYSDSNFSRTLNIGNGYSNYYVFRGSSIYDPDFTGVGVQPYGFDQYLGAALYTNFRVAASSISVYFRAEETYANIRRLHAFIIPFRLSAPILTDVSDVRMIPFQKETTYDGANESTRGAKMKHYMSTKKLIKEYSPTDNTWSGSYASNPSVVWYWLVHFYTDVYDDEEVDIYFDVKIKYYSIINRSDVPNES